MCGAVEGTQGQASQESNQLESQSLQPHETLERSNH